MIKGYLKVSEVAEMLDLSRAAVNNLCRSEGFPAYRIGKSWRIKRDEFEKWIEERRNGRNDFYSNSD